LYFFVLFVDYLNEETVFITHQTNRPEINIVKHNNQLFEIESSVLSIFLFLNPHLHEFSYILYQNNQNNSISVYKEWELRKYSWFSDVTYCR